MCGLCGAVVLHEECPPRAWSRFSAVFVSTKLTAAVIRLSTGGQCAIRVRKLSTLCACSRDFAGHTPLLN